MSPDDREKDLDKEIRAHLELEAEERQAHGLPAEDARWAALRAFGNVTRTREDVRAIRTWTWLDDLRADVRYALRSLARAPGFACVGLLTLTLGIGANTAIFSIVSALLLQPLPFPEGDRLVHIFETYRGPLGRPLRQPLPAEDLRVLRESSRTLTDVDAYGVSLELRLGRDEQAELPGARLSRSTLSTLGARPAVGRLFDDGESERMDPVLVLSDLAWRRHFGGDPAVIGRAVYVEGTFPPPFGLPRQVFTVIGVMAADFRFPSDETAFWVPLNLAREGGRGAIARLRDGMSIEAATSEVAAMFGPGRPESTFEVVRLRDEQGSAIRPALAVLLVSVAVVLLIACANLTNLLLARTTARQRELALRAALGAARGRVVRQLMTECVLLALLGGVGGIVLALGGIRALGSLFAGLATRPDLAQLGNDFGRSAAMPLVDPSLDTTTLALTGAICLIAGLVSGTAPALLSPRGDYMRLLHEGAGSAMVGFRLLGRNTTRSTLVVAQVTLAIALLVAGGLLMRSFVRMVTLDKGYDARPVLTFNVRFPQRGPSAVENAGFAEDLVSRLRRLRGITEAGYTFALPTVSLGMATELRLSPGEQLPPSVFGTGSTPTNPGLLFVSPGYAKALGMRIVAGRHLDEYLQAGGRRGVLINETLARARFPGEQPTGRPVYLGGELDRHWEIAGVVEDVWRGLDQAPGPQVFAIFPPPTDPVMQALGTRYYYAVRTEGDPMSALPSVREAVRQLNPEALLDNVAPLEDLLASSIARPRMYTVFLGIFAGVAVVLAAVGIYGVMAYAVAQNTREFGLRLALGARRSEVLTMVIGRAGLLTAIGLVLGFAAAIGLSRYLSGIIFGLTPLDAPTYVAVGIVFALVALIASYLPARRATRIDPLTALRAD